jgi:hypothetical protein
MQLLKTMQRIPARIRVRIRNPLSLHKLEIKVQFVEK